MDRDNNSATIIPTLRYNDAPAAIAWLCRAFGFEERMVVPGQNGTIAHAQLTFGNGMIMLGSTGQGGGEYDRLIRQPGDTGGASTQAPYVIVGDVDAHCSRAQAAGAEVFMAPADQDYGGRNYACLDLEGHLWNFGSYDPWAERSA
ncbi:MAG: VOC family protein [Proteobacteria bacterium]|nr:VOC family protein [Pseudomonadota bacterium]